MFEASAAAAAAAAAAASLSPLSIFFSFPPFLTGVPDLSKAVWTSLIERGEKEEEKGKKQEQTPFEDQQQDNDVTEVRLRVSARAAHAPKLHLRNTITVRDKYPKEMNFLSRRRTITTCRVP